ncbi:MAG: hypothetical protein ABIF82_02985 [Planctomycetota bacterium]
MCKHNRMAAAFLAAMTILAAAAVNAADMPVMPDRIILVGEAQITNIKIISADVSGITYRRFDDKGDTTTVPAVKVEEISWGDAGEFRRALALYKKPDPPGALKALRELPATGPRAFWYGPYRHLLIGECLYLTKKYEDAIPEFRIVTRQHSRSFYALKAIEGAALSYKALGKPTLAAQAYAEFDPHGAYGVAGSPDPYGKMWQWRGRLGMADAYADVPGKAEEAGKIYAGLVRGTGAALAKLAPELKADEPEIRRIQQLALVGAPKALMKAEKFDEAIKSVESVQDRIQDKAARVGMYAMLGELLAGKAEKAAENEKGLARKKALLAYMRVYILYPGHKAERLKAMLGAATMSRLLGTPEDNRRAVRLCQEIVAEFPNSDEARRAKLMLQTLGIKG